jgi:two-component system C4-dicarboxylate transport response regulator DctD
MSRTVLLVDDDAPVREALSQTLELADVGVIAAGSFVAAKDKITAGFEGIILSDMRMPGRDGFHLLEYAREQDPDLPVILLTGEGDIPMAVRAMEAGAFDFLEKPCAPASLLAVIERALKTRALVLENRRLLQMVEKGDPAARLIFGTSDLAEALRAKVRRAARTDAEVLVTGPYGSGISKVAEVIHLSSQRSKSPFVKRAGEGLSASELADALLAAAGGSLFLDEVTHLPAQTQLSLIEAMENAPAVRLIAGSTQDLSAMVGEGRFHADLYYRLEVMPVRIPSLAERPEDIAILFRRYVDQAAEQSGLVAPDVTPQIIAGLIARDWPGNARALMSAAMRFVMGVAEDAGSDAQLGLAEQMAQVEQSLLRAALRRAGGQASTAAKALRLPRKTFYDKLTRYGIRAEDYRA